MHAKNRDVGIDFLKGVAFLLVFAVHSVQFVEKVPVVVRFVCMYGQTGVQLFLMLSGILFAKSYRVNGFKSYVSGLKKRYLNIMPLYICFALVYWCLNVIFARCSIRIPFHNNRSVWALLVNALLVHGFVPFANNNVVPGGWYIGAYFAMLITAPAIFLVYTKAKNKRNFFVRLGIIASIFISLISFALLYRFDIGYSNGDFAYFSFVNQYPAFLIGIEIGLSQSKTHNNPWSTAVAFLSFTMLSVLCFVAGQSWCYSLVPMLAALSFRELYRLVSVEPVRRLIAHLRYLTFIGKNSYAAYLLSFIFAWYIPLIINRIIPINGIPLLLASWVIMFVLLPVLSHYLTEAQSCVRRLLKRG